MDNQQYKKDKDTEADTTDQHAREAGKAEEKEEEAHSVAPDAHEAKPVEEKQKSTP